MRQLIADVNDAPVDYQYFNRAIWGSSSEGCNNWISSITCRIRNIGTDNTIEGFSTPGEIISEAFPFIFGIAGLILFVMLVIGAFEIMLGAATPKSAESGKHRITSALVGFIILFSAYWIAQIIQAIFGIEILGN